MTVRALGSLAYDALSRFSRIIDANSKQYTNLNADIKLLNNRSIYL